MSPSLPSDFWLPGPSIFLFIFGETAGALGIVGEIGLGLIAMSHA